jgi:hypothetical protein
MRMTIKSFNGHTLNDASYETAGLNFSTPAGADLNFVQIANQDPVDAGVFAGRARSFILWVTIKPYATRATLAEQLAVWFKRGTSGTLIATYTDGTDYQVEARVQAMVPEPKSSTRFTVTLQVGASSWRKTLAETSTWAATSSALTKAITVGGVEETRLVAAITPTATSSSGWRYQYLYQLVSPHILIGKRPWCITIDTAALVTAGKLQADCDDLRVVDGDQETKRWIADPNTNHTHVWFNRDFTLGWSLKLKTAIASSGAIGEIIFAANDNTDAVLRALPASGLLMHGTEWIQYSGKSLKYRKLGVVTRGALGTTLQAHAANAVFDFIQAPVWVLAGNAAATNPATDDDTYDDDKPVFDLSASDNTQWVYTASTVFYDPLHPERPGSWKPLETCGGSVSENYNITQNAETGNPALGMLMGSWLKNGRWQNESGSVNWSLSCPSGFTTISLTGSKYRNTVRWPATAALQRSTDGTSYVTVWSETSPVNASTWTAFTHSSVSVTGKYLRVVLSGSIVALANAACDLEMLTATAVFSTTLLPAGTLLGEGSNYPLAIMITNMTNGDQVTLVYPMLTNRVFLLDGENFLATYDGVNAHGAIDLDDDSRDAWIRLEPGSNTLQIDPVTAGDDIGTLSIALSWYPRRP